MGAPIAMARLAVSHQIGGGNQRSDVHQRGGNTIASELLDEGDRGVHLDVVICDGKDFG